MQERVISGFSKKEKTDKINWLARHFSSQPEATMQKLKEFWHPDQDQQRILDGFSENTLTNFPMPYGVAPNFRINGQMYAVPMVIEESSVVAAASSAAKFWLPRGGFQAQVLSTVKLGQLHFLWKGNGDQLRRLLPELEIQLKQETVEITQNMERRGGGILSLELIDYCDQEPDYFQLLVRFETCDSMGANFINSVLEQYGKSLNTFLARRQELPKALQSAKIVMAILSNYTPECIVRAEVSCPIEELQGACPDHSAAEFAERFRLAVRIAEIDPYRAATHNKGIFNGIDAVVLATGNDFRAIEACGHAYAARDGQYRSLSHCTLQDGQFRFWLDIPLALGTVGGLTNLHPLAKETLELLGKPGATELMEVTAAVGLAQNFGALRSLVTTGIQHGHMKMHLLNILNHLKATPIEQEAALAYFSNATISFAAVRNFLENSRAR